VRVSFYEEGSPQMDRHERVQERYPAKQTAAHLKARRAIVDGPWAGCARYYGIELALDDSLAADFIADPCGDKLDPDMKHEGND
jgi:hypothetical protein